MYGMMLAPLSGQSGGLAKAQVTHGVRELVLCKGGDGKIGLRCQVDLKMLITHMIFVIQLLIDSTLTF